MNLTQLPYIVAIARTGSLRSAADQVGISQSALSHYLSKLESELGLELFWRAKKRMYLTPAGQKYVQTAQQILELMEGTRQSILQLEQPITQELRVGVSPHSGARILAEIYTPFNRRFPSVRLLPREDYAENLKNLLRQGEIDLCVTSGEETNGLNWYPIGCSEIVLAVPAALDTAMPSREEDTVTDLSAFRNSVFILPEKPSSVYDAVSDILKEADFQPKVFFRSPNVLMLRQMISSGAGIGFLPLYNVVEDPSLRVFHLSPPRKFYTCVYTRIGHCLTEPEQYFFFLLLSRNTGFPGLVSTELNRDLLWKYGLETTSVLNRRKLT